MKILYLSAVVSDTFFSELFSNGKTTSYVGQKFHGMFIKGLENHYDDITVLSQPPTSKLNFKITDKQNKIQFAYTPIIPFPFLKQIIIILYTFLYFTYWCIKNIREKKVIICSIMRIYQFVPILLLTHIFRCKKITIACDIPWMTITQVKTDKLSFKQKTTIYLSKKLSSIFDAYIFLTEPMNNILNPHKKPYIVIEGFCDIAMNYKSNNLEEKYDKNIIVYAGGLNIKYGIDKLIEAVNNLQSNQVELWLFGKGDMVQKIKSDDKIKYWGVCSNNEIINTEIKATLLINPRPTKDEYTIYSFPSKTLEYMSSGTYTITTRLSGIPKEYYDYCGIIEEDTSDSIKKAIETALSLGKNTLHNRGMKAKEFVMCNKNNIVQTLKVKKLLNSLYNE